METNGTLQEKISLDGLPPQVQRSLLEYESYRTNSQMMAQIMHQMKEIPVLPSEIPPANDRNALTRVEFPDEGGVLTFMEGYSLPYRGFPLADLVEKIDVIKKVAKASISGLYHSLKERRLMILTLLPAFFVFRNIVTAGVYTFWRLIERFRIKKERLSQCMRALHTSFTDVETPLEELKIMLRDLVCNVLEFDNAYRFRAQDLIEVMDKEKMLKNPVKELKRIMTVAQERETTQEIKDTWKLGKLFVSFYLRFDRKLLALFRDVLLGIDVSKFKLTPEDIQFCAKRKDYVFGFMKN